jgi:hypothetical protein
LGEQQALNRGAGLQKSDNFSRGILTSAWHARFTCRV